ncbi:MAG: lamin tail domain-containing protein [Bacteroidota bacterium]
MRLILFLLLPIGLLAQPLIDDFSDGDLLNPDWQGQVDIFEVQDERLRLMDTTGGTSLIYLPARTELTSPNTSWEWLAELEFSPSSSNFAEVRLTIAPPTGTSEDEGYILRIGGISGSDDALVLYRIDQGFGNPLITATVGGVGGDPAVARIRLSRSSDGQWTLEADYSGGTNYQVEGTATDETFPTLGYFGWYNVYTATRSDLIYFDNLRVEPLVADEEVPVLLDFEVPQADRIVLAFSEAIEANSGEDPNNYNLMGTGAPTVITAGIRPAEVQIIDLDLDGDLTPLENYSLSISGLEDEAGNTIGDTTIEFTYRPVLEPDENRLLLTEIMADPTPEVGLPDAEYIEIYNATQLPVQLAGLELSSGGSPQLLGSFLLEPNAYVLVTDDGNASEFGPAVPLTTVSSFPSLTNGGDVVILTYAGRGIDAVRYDDSWYADPDREDGGYSLERIGLDTTESSDCAGRWRASLANAGGTPGAENSVNMQPLETEPPRIVGVSVDAALPDQISLLLSEAAAEEGAVADFDISVSPPDFDIAAVEVVGDAVTVSLSDDLMVSTAYEITFNLGLSDCLGNRSSEGQTFIIGLPEVAEVGDVVINELLFNPFTGGVDFLELFNCSEKVLQIQDWQLLNDQSTSSTALRFVDAERLFLPGQYLVLTPDPDDVLMRYEQAQAEFLIEQPLPSMPDDAGNISVFNRTGLLLDAYDYSEDQHSALLDDEDGVSLERLDPKLPTNGGGNWFTAASNVGFATPTRINSQNRPNLLLAENDANFFSLPERTFSPDGDSFQDVLRIDYQTPNAGWQARVRIYDGRGRLVRTLRRVELLAGQGNLLWDGANDDGFLARSGAYVILVELFEPGGGTRTEQLVAALYNG